MPDVILKISSELNLQDDAGLRQALRRDEAEIADLLKYLLSSDAGKATVSSLKGDEAQSFMDLLQFVWQISLCIRCRLC